MGLGVDGGLKKTKLPTLGAPAGASGDFGDGEIFGGSPIGNNEFYFGFQTNFLNGGETGVIFGARMDIGIVIIDCEFFRIIGGYACFFDGINEF